MSNLYKLEELTLTENDVKIIKKRRSFPFIFATEY